MAFVVLSSILFDQMNWTRIRSGDSDQVSEILSKGFDAKLLLKDVQDDTPHFAGIKRASFKGIYFNFFAFPFGSF